MPESSEKWYLSGVDEPSVSEAGGEQSSEEQPKRSLWIELRGEAGLGGRDNGAERRYGGLEKPEARSRNCVREVDAEQEPGIVRHLGNFDLLCITRMLERGMLKKVGRSLC